MLCVNVGEECLTVVRVLFSFLVEKYRSHAAALHVILFVFHMSVCEQFVSSFLRIQSVTAVLVSEPEPNFPGEQEYTHFCRSGDCHHVRLFSTLKFPVFLVSFTTMYVSITGVSARLI